MGKLGRIVGFIAVVATVLAQPAAAATHLSGSFSFHGALCGFSGAVQVKFIDNFGGKADGSSFDSGAVLETFVADNGRGVTIFFSGHQENLPPAVNPDGTTTFVTIYGGAQFKIQAVDGPVLQQNAGRLQVAAIVAQDGSLVSFSVDVLAGPNPNTTGNENSAESCSVIGPYLAATT